MGIGRLWHYTRSDGADRFRKDNEARAAAFYGRWRTAYVVVEDLLRRALDRRRDARRRRTGLRELGALSNRLLDDVGLRLDGTGRLVGTTRTRGEDLRRAYGDAVRPFAPPSWPREVDAPVRSGASDERSHRRAA